MRERYDIKVEIDEAQQDLEQNIGELKDVLLDKVDIKAKLDREIERRKDQAIEAAARGREVVLDVYAQARTFVRDNPLIAVGVGVGLVLVGGAIWKLRHELKDE